MPRYKLTIEYDGGPFFGWQRQASGPSVQAALEAAVTGFCGEEVTVHGAGRTDAGVHALGQVAHLDLDRAAAPATVRDALNFHLRPAPVSVLAVEHAAAGFDARRSARERIYRYRIMNRRGPLALDRGRAWHVAGVLDSAAMAGAASRFLGHHDFTTFRANRCQAKSPVRTLDALDVRHVGAEIRIEARARSFLHHQVRNMVGTLRLVGEGRWTADDVTAALDARDRAAGGPTAPAEGLYLTEVLYA
jgi:tRNA pseudouridine38-40 synthase